MPTSWVNSLKLWPAVTAFSFAFVPLEFRSLFAGGIAIGWQAYLSALNKRAEKALREEMTAAGQGGEEGVVLALPKIGRRVVEEEEVEVEEVQSGGLLQKVGLA